MSPFKWYDKVPVKMFLLSVDKDLTGLKDFSSLFQVHYLQQFSYLVNVGPCCLNCIGATVKKTKTGKQELFSTFFFLRKLLKSVSNTEWRLLFKTVEYLYSWGETDCCCWTYWYVLKFNNGVKITEATYAHIAHLFNGLPMGFRKSCRSLFPIVMAISYVHDV